MRLVDGLTSLHRALFGQSNATLKDAWEASFGTDPKKGPCLKLLHSTIWVEPVLTLRLAKGLHSPCASLCNDDGGRGNAL